MSYFKWPANSKAVIFPRKQLKTSIHGAICYFKVLSGRRILSGPSVSVFTKALSVDCSCSEDRKKLISYIASCKYRLQNHRIIKVGKTSKIIKSNF